MSPSSNTQFLGAILESPDDDGPRLVYADWLDERGDHDRAEFIRLQCELARMAAHDSRYMELRGRELALKEAHGWGWYREVFGQSPPRLQDWGDGFDRGFPDYFFGTARDYLRRGRDLHAKTPLRRAYL